MTPEQLALLADSRLSDAARLLALYMQAQGTEPREYHARELAPLLHGLPTAQTVWRHVRQLEVADYVVCTQEQGGRDHGKWYRWIGGKKPADSLPLKEIPGNESIPLKETGGNGTYPGNPSGVSAPMGGGYMGGETPPVSIHPTRRASGSRTTPASPEELQPIRDWLGPHAAAVSVFAGSAEHGGTWPSTVMGIWGPGGTRREFWSTVPPERQPQVVAEALLAFASDYPAEPFDRRLFESILTSCRDGKPKKASTRPAEGSEAARIHHETPGAQRILDRVAGTQPLNLARLRAEIPAAPAPSPTSEKPAHVA